MIMKLVLLSIPRLLLPSLVFAVSLQAQEVETAPLTQHQIVQILNADNRPAEDRIRDQARRSDKILAFTGIAPGDTVLDLFAGGGWYTELFSRAVGSDGKVYAQNDQVIWRFAKQGMQARTKDQRLDNIAIADIDVPNNSVNTAFVALNYHDLFFTSMVRDGEVITLRDEVVDHKKVLAKLAQMLKDDGQVIIIHHAAHAGSGYEAANTLHRIDPNIVKFHFAEAGFTLLEEAFYLRNKNDNYDTNVFDPSIRGKTDRFIFKFGK